MFCQVIWTLGCCVLFSTLHIQCNVIHVYMIEINEYAISKLCDIVQACQALALFLPAKDDVVLFLSSGTCPALSG